MDLFNKEKLYTIIFKADTRLGKLFDVGLLIVILISIFVVMLESIPDFQSVYKSILSNLEWVITIIFTIEYAVRLLICRKPLKYAISFYGVIDLLAILPTYLGLFVTGAHPLIIVRALRLLRMFRILKLSQYSSQGLIILSALKRSRQKISVFIAGVLTIVLIVGTLMYLIEGGENGFTSIPKGIYWAIVTLTTVGYGDIAPQTNLGQFIASVVMIMGYAIIAVPTGIVTAELTRQNYEEHIPKCEKCGATISGERANYCSNCGEPIGSQAV